MRALANALYDLALRQGVTFKFETSVSEIVVRYGRVVGVRTAATEIPAGLVVHAGDAQALATGLFGAEATRAVKAIEREDRSLSAYTFSMLARPTGHPLARHTVVFSDDYAREFRELFSQRILPSEPTVYICAQDREGPGGIGPAVSRGAAPSEFAAGRERTGPGGNGPAVSRNAAPSEFAGGRERTSPGGNGYTGSGRSDDVTRLFLIVNAPAIGDDGPLPVAELDRCEATLHRLLNDCGFQLNPEKTVRRTPFDFAKRFPATGGALYGRASHGPFSAFQRPGATTPIPGLFLASGSIHPGAGVPMAALSGRLAAIAAVAASPSTRRSPPTATAGSTPTA
jgi:1-hydroxycarotenoid 3,4-desaturase